MKDKPGERQAKEKSQWRRQEAAAGGKRRAGPDGGEHQQGGDEQPGNLRLEREAKRKGKNVITETDRNIADSPRWERCAISSAKEQAGRQSW